MTDTFTAADQISVVVSVLAGFVAGMLCTYGVRWPRDRSW